MSDRGNSDPVKNPKFIDLTDFPSVQKKVELQLRAPDGKRAWRSLDELAGTGEFREMMNREFPAAAGEWDDNVSRRNFMKLMGASLALAGLTSACAPKPEEKIVPYVQQPEHLVPGRPFFFASAMPFNGFGKGVLVEQHEGRPTKIEGNPDHPSSKGAADVWGQATILTLYDPDRSQVITRFGNVSSWGTFNLALASAVAFQDWNTGKRTRRSKPARVRLLTETVTSPTVAGQVEALKQAVPDLKWHKYDAVGRDHTLAGAKQAFGQDVEPIYDFSKAKVVVSLDSNFLTEDPGSLRYARDYMQLRRVRATPAAAEMAKLDGKDEGNATRLKPGNRLFAIESVPTVVGAIADHKLRVKPQFVHEFAAALHEAVAAGGGSSLFKSAAWRDKTGKKHDDHMHYWFDELVTELLEHKGQSIVIAGEYAPVEVHVLAHAINAALGNISAGDESKPVSLIPVVSANAGNSVESITELTQSLKAGEVDLLFILGGNPVYTAPADLNFGQVLADLYPADEKGKITGKCFVAHLGLYEDETARLAEWHVPEAHFLEAWGDVRGHDGTASIIQPLIAPLYQGCKSTIEVLATLAEVAAPATGAATRPATGPVGSLSGYDTVRGVWRKALEQGDQFEAVWTKSLHDGVIEGSAYKPAAVSFKGDAAKASLVPAATGMTIMFRPDPHIWDGSFNNNAWLQELPKPLTKLTWDNALLVSPRAAYAMLHPDAPVAEIEKHGPVGNVFKEKLAEANGKTVELTVNGQTLKDVPLWIVPGHPDNCATLHLGYGRSFAGRVGSPVDGTVGFNAYALRASQTRWLAAGDVKANGGSYALAVTQNHQVINHELNHKRELILHGNGIGEVADEFTHHMAEREGTPLEAGHSHEFKYNADKNLATARRIGLPIIPDDPSTSLQSVFPEQPDHPEGHDPMFPAWGMVIDQTACIGCNACVIACQAENNIPVVGKEQVMVEREMHWLRIDTYYIGGKLEGDADGHSDEVDIADPDGTYFQPLPCMHCEKAPCELVCPVGATIHSKEGLNEMTYNRCVGTRYCSNNCPYKVRRFNFLKYNDEATPVLKLLRNPEVTVRSRGVMEKCTYCVQRINRGRIEAKKVEVAALQAGAGEHEARKAFDAVLNTVETACQQSCPTEAIIFGNMWDPDAHVTALKREPVGFHYGLLAELNTRPRTTYLARIENKYDDFVDHKDIHVDESHGPGKDAHKH